MVLRQPAPAASAPLRLESAVDPAPAADEVLLRVRACGVCRTDLHLAEGDLAPHRDRVVPGHQIVGDVIGCGASVSGLGTGMRVGVTWLGGVDGTCSQCRAGRENLCDHPVFTGYDRDGGYAEYVTARADFVFRIPEQLDDVHAAPLLCAGTIGFRSARVAEVQHGEAIGLYGFGASAHLLLPLLKAWNCRVYVATRGEPHRELAQQLGADWTGDALDRPPVELDRAITFAPSGGVVVAALSALRKGGVVAINAIHLDGMPAFDYDTLLWGERQIRSVANLTRDDARDFLRLVAQIRLRPNVETFPLHHANAALVKLKSDALSAAAVIVP